MRRHVVLGWLTVAVFAGAACGGSRSGGTVTIGGPSLEPRRVTIRTLEPGPRPTPTPSPTPSPSPGPPPSPIPPPAGATITSAAGTQEGAPNSFCWSTQVGAASSCYEHAEPSQGGKLIVRRSETALLRIEARIPPSEESVRPFQGSRSGFPAQPVDPALETDLTVDLPPGEWSLDLCATWHGRGQPICWLFRFDVR